MVTASKSTVGFDAVTILKLCKTHIRVTSIKKSTTVSCDIYNMLVSAIFRANDAIV